MNENIRKEVHECAKDAIENNLNIDTFGKLMDEAIERTEIGMFIHKEKHQKEFDVVGAGCGAVMDLYVYLNAMRSVYMNLCREIKKIISKGENEDVNFESMTKMLLDELREIMMSAAQEVQEEGETK